MPSTYLALNFHVVFATRSRSPLIDSAWRANFHTYLGGTVRGLGATPLSIGGVEDHVHLLIGLRGTHAVGDVVREIKKSGTAWARTKRPDFAWQEGYGAFAVSPGDLATIRAYIENQEEHHRKLSSADELRAILMEFGLPIDERYFE